MRRGTWTRLKLVHPKWNSNFTSSITLTNTPRGFELDIYPPFVYETPAPPPTQQSDAEEDTEDEEETQEVNDPTSSN